MRFPMRENLARCTFTDRVFDDLVRRVLEDDRPLGQLTEDVDDPSERLALEEAKKAPKPEEKAEAKAEQAAAEPAITVTAVRKRIRNLFGG